MWRGNPCITRCCGNLLNLTKGDAFSLKPPRIRAPQPPTVKCLTTTYIHPPGRKTKTSTAPEATPPRWRRHRPSLTPNTPSRTIAAGIPTYVASQPYFGYASGATDRRHHIDRRRRIHHLHPLTEPQPAPSSRPRGLHRFLIDRATLPTAALSEPADPALASYKYRHPVEFVPSRRPGIARSRTSRLTIIFFNALTLNGAGVIERDRSDDPSSAWKENVSIRTMNEDDDNMTRDRRLASLPANQWLMNVR